MIITDINVRKLYDNKKLSAVVSVTFDNSFVVHDIKVIKGFDRMFVAMPSKRTSDGRFSDVAHPVTRELRREIEVKVLDAYNTAVKEL